MKGEDEMKKTNAVALCSILLLSTFTVLSVITRPAYAMPKSLYVCSEHHKRLFDAYNVNPDGTVTFQARYTLAYATDPAGIAIHEGDNTLFITSEFSSGVEMVNATTMTSLGKETGPSNLAGIDVDDANDIIYAVRRNSDDLYAYDWDPSTRTLTPKAGFNPYDLPGCSGAYGIALDERAGILWVADTAAGVARAYSTTSWTEDATKSFTPSHKPVDIDVDWRRGFVYTVSMSYGAWVPPGTGSNLISKFDLATRTETTHNMGFQGVGIAVDEVTGLVYLTGASGNDALSVWDTSSFTLIQMTADLGNPAGICIPEEAGYNKLGLTKDDGLAEDESACPGDTITYTICFDNTLNDFAVHNVVLVDDLPAETTLVSASDGGNYDPITHTVTWNIGVLPARAPQDCVTLVVTVKPNTTPNSTIVNYATINADEPGTGPTTKHEETGICPKHWEYIFEDTFGRGTILKISTKCHFFQFIAPSKDYGIRKATYMLQYGWEYQLIIIDHYDSELRLVTVTVNTKLDLCKAVAWDQQTGKLYILYDVPGIE